MVWRVRIAAARPLVVTASAVVLAFTGLVMAPVSASAADTDAGTSADAPAAGVAITEFAYGGLIGGSSVGGDGEYVEVTNVGTSDVDVSGWSYGTAAAPGTVPLTGFGTLTAGESAIITDVTPAEFRADWGLKDSVKVVNDGTTTLNKGPKTMYLYDADGNTIDSGSYASGFLAGGKGQSAWVDTAHVGAESDTTGWTFSTVGDEQQSWTSATGSVGSPGTSSLGIGDAASVRVPIGGGTPPVTDPYWSDIVINEVTSDNDGIGFAPLPALADGIELYNKGTHDVNLAGWKQIDSGAAGSATDFSAGLYVNGVLSTVIPAGDTASSSRPKVSPAAATP
jgi:hypothetical protein